MLEHLQEWLLPVDREDGDELRVVGVLVVDSLKSDRELLHLTPLLEINDKQLVHASEVGGHDDRRLQGGADLAEALGRRRLSTQSTCDNGFTM